MARSRNIKPGFFKNEELVELPFEDRLLFAGLWTLADCRGVLEDRPKRIKMEIFPADNVDVGECLARLSERGLVVRYDADGTAAIFLPGFARNQNPHQNEKPSGILLPDECAQVTDSIGAQDEYGAGTRVAPEQHQSNRADSLFTDSLSTDPLTPDTPEPQASPAGEYTPAFNQFWGAYPNRKGKAQAFKAWRKLSLPDRDAALRDVPERLRRDREWIKDGGQYIPHASTYLNQRRWDDDIQEQSRETHQRDTPAKLTPAQRVEAAYRERFRAQSG